MRRALVVLLIVTIAPAQAFAWPVLQPAASPAAPTPAPATPPTPPPVDQAGPHYREGVARFGHGDFAAAAAAFRAAYAIDPDPAYLYNIGQAYRLAKDCANAKQFLQAYVAAAPAGARERPTAAHVLLAIDACAMPPTSPPPPPERPRATHHRRRLAGMISAGTGVIAAGLAAIFGWRAHRASLDIEDTLRLNGGTWTPALEAREHDAQRADAAAIGLSIGSAAAMLGGGLLWYSGRF